MMRIDHVVILILWCLFSEIDGIKTLAHVVKDGSRGVPLLMLQGWSNCLRLSFKQLSLFNNVTRNTSLELLICNFR